MLKFLPCLLVVIFAASTGSAKSCLGFPRVEGFSSELKNFCLGLVADAGVGWSAPRQLLFMGPSKLIVSDFGAWKNPNLGRVWQIDLQSNRAKTIYSKGRLTHGLGLDSSGRLLIGTQTK